MRREEIEIRLLLEAILERHQNRFHHLNNMRVTISTFYTSFVAAVVAILVENNGYSDANISAILTTLVVFGVVVTFFEQIVHDRAIGVRSLIYHFTRRLNSLDGRPTREEKGLGIDDSIFTFLPFLSLDFVFYIGWRVERNITWLIVAGIVVIVWFCFFLLRCFGKSPFVKKYVV